MRGEKGRFIIVQGVMEGEVLFWINIYAPNGKSKGFFQKLIQILETVIEEDTIILMGDFNSVVGPKKGRSKTTFMGELPSNIRLWLKQCHSNEMV